MGTTEIILRDLAFYGFHGVYPEEHDTGTHFRVDVRVVLGAVCTGHDDDVIDHTLNYERLVEVVLALGTNTRCCLVERLAQTMCEAILALGAVALVDVTVHKRLTSLTPEPLWISVRRVLEAG
ncbi:MAG: dihydroneopterin aldolase [Proteobacteria bacterium]|nr:dihydroneopterin aldolase [Pseudomonadota bacterium]